MLPSPWCRWAAHAIGRVAATLLLICVPATFTPHLRPIPSQASAADGRWRPLFVGRRAGHTAIYDPVGHRMIAFGGSSNDAWALPLGVPPAWKLLDICGTGPTYFAGHAAIHDPVRGRMVVLANGEVWALSLGCSPQWTRLDVSGSVPPPIDGPRAVYDSARDEMLIFGGNIILSQYGRQLTNRIWVLSLSTNTWTEIVPDGALPSQREKHAAIYDRVRDRLVVFGGNGVFLDYSDEVWAFSRASNTWTQLTPAGPAPAARAGHVGVYDPVVDALVVYGGQGSNGGLSDSWALSLGPSPAWTQLAAGIPGPGARRDCAAIFDPGSGHMVVNGGRPMDGFNQKLQLDDSWSLDPGRAGSWQMITPPVVPFGGNGTVLDPVRHRAIANTFDGQVWALSLSGAPTWTKLAPSGPNPGQRYGTSLVYDSPRDRALLFGGAGGTYFNDIWALSLADPPQWTLLSTPGDRPEVRANHRAVYDPVHDRMIIHAGDDTLDYASIPDCHNDTWSLSLATLGWTRIGTTGDQPLPVYSPSLVYDAAGDRAIAFAGTCLDFDNNFVHALDGPTGVWSDMAPSGTPPADRYYHGAIVDPGRNRMVITGGYRLGPLGAETWAMSLSGTPTWTQLAPDGAAPSAGDTKDAFYDPVGDRLVAVGSLSVWVLSFSDQGGGCASSTTVGLQIKPDQLNLASMDRWITAYIDPIAPLTAADVDVASLALNGVAADPATATVERAGRTLKVKFPRSEVNPTLSPGDSVPVQLVGRVGSECFEATDVISVRAPHMSHPTAGSQIAAGSTLDVNWVDTDDLRVPTLTLVATFDGGETWSIQAEGIPNNGAYRWTVPDVVSSNVRIGLVTVYEQEETGQVREVEVAESETFEITSTVNVGGVPELAFWLGVSPNPSAGTFTADFSLRGRSPAELVLLDVGGRVVARRGVGGLGAGRHQIGFGRNEPLPTGVYLIRLSQAGERRVARAVVFR